VAFPQEALADGPIGTTDVISLAANERISESTLRRAKKRAGVLDGRSGFGRGSYCHWTLPAKPTSGTTQTRARKLSKYGTYGA
jgi:hypothetical protein